MATREQENRIDQLALAHGRTCVRDGFVDHVVRVTVPDGTEHFVNEDGVFVRTGLNFSVDWS